MLGAAVVTVPTLARAIPVLREVLCDDKGYTTDELIEMVCDRFESTEEEKKQMSECEKFDTPIAVWVATATLHRKCGDDGPFTTRQIKEMVIRQGLFKVEIATVIDNIRAHCVAGSPASSPRPSRQCKLHRVDEDQYRLWRKGDYVHLHRQGGPSVQDLANLPTEYKHLLEWYSNIYCKGQY